jgi:lysophospholipase L1-like esterase
MVANSTNNYLYHLWNHDNFCPKLSHLPFYLYAFLKDVLRLMPSFNKTLLNVFQKIIPFIALGAVTTSFLFLSLYVCETILHLKNYENKVGFLDFFINSQSGIYSIDKELIFSFEKDEFYRNFNFYDPSVKNKIAMFGDSATWGWGASDDITYPITYQKLYNQSHPKEVVTILNFGVPGYGIDQEYILAKNKVLQYKPSLIVWNINVNDVWDNNYQCLFKPVGNNWQQISGTHSIGYWYGWFRKHLPTTAGNSNLFNFIWQSFYNRVTNSEGDDRFTFGCSNAKPDESVKKITLNRLAVFIADLKKEQEKNNNKLIVTLIPYQQYFDNQSPISNLAPDYFSLKETIKNSQVNFIDFNEIILKKLDPKFYFKYRLSTKQTNNYLPKLSAKHNIAQTYFLDGPPDSAPFGWRHPNQKMYDLMAKSLIEYTNKLKLTL